MRIPSPILLATTLVVSDTAFAQSERRAQLSFTGTTLASEMLIQDVMRNVMEIAAEDLDCAMPDAVVADLLPESFRPAKPATAPEGAGKPVYERWTIDFCGDEVPFLLTFWTLEQGGTAFDLDYPFNGGTVTGEEGTRGLQ